MIEPRFQRIRRTSVPPRDRANQDGPQAPNTVFNGKCP